MTGPFLNGVGNHRGKLAAHTIASLQRWSCLDKQLPSVNSIKALHVYDFDNTLFCSPLPNQRLWNQRTSSTLQTPEGYGTGGWWHNTSFLEATGEGLEKEEPKAWKGWWNEDIVELVQLSCQQDDTVTILLTGRAERLFDSLIRRMIRAKQLDFDLVCLKPEAGPSGQKLTTMDFKRTLLQDLVTTYREATEIRIYEDRPKHTKAFRDFFEQANMDLQFSTLPDARKPINATVIQVADQQVNLDPVVETAEVQRLVNDYNQKTPPPSRNLEIKKHAFYTGYLISPSDTTKLLGLVNNLPNMNSSDVKFLANNILISFGTASPETLMKVGGIGHKQDWQITSIGVHQQSIWAARLTPLPSNSLVHTEYATPYVILAHLKATPLSHAGRIQTWIPLLKDKQYIITTTVGEKVQLSVEPESDDSDNNNNSSNNNNNHSNGNHNNSNSRMKRRPSPLQGAPAATRRAVAADENRRPSNGTQHPQPQGPRNASGQQHSNRNRGRNNGGANGNSNNRSGNRGGGGGGNGSNNKTRNNGGGGGGGSGSRGYKSLDDMGRQQGHQRGEPNYDDYVVPGTVAGNARSGMGASAYDTAFPALGADVTAGGLNYGK